MRSTRFLQFAASRFLRQSERRLFPENGFRFFESPADVSGTADIPAKISLTLTRQDEFLLKQEPVLSLVLRTSEGELGILAGHEYSIEQLAPGVLDVEFEGEKKERYAISGGFAHVNDNGVVDINVVEAIPIAEVDSGKLQSKIEEARANLGNADPMIRAHAEIALEVYEPLELALRGAI
eukprot:NODE_8093_length_711_cov_34.860544_g7474_i0.p1 GENE.NODE_8093_length_711_cov_34.860544_g7474_i0~~NODE_8093_length_711_cov_34.860544_g7474_i0.p1  ORF type:complete len:198 (+),score=44.47 NODE_8093_length_711_cov_34.860544_g7474_i0:57-596(+)